MYRSIQAISVLGFLGKSEYVSYDLTEAGTRTEVKRYPFDPQAVPADLSDIIREGFMRDKPNVILDMGNIPWLNSKGLGTLVMLYHLVGDHGGQLSLARPVSDVVQHIQAANLGNVFEVFGSVGEARDHLRSLNVP